MLMHRNEFSTLTWHVPPELQGQTAEVAYAACDGLAIRRVIDRSYTPGDERRTTYEACSFMDLHGDPEWEPWNEEPDIPPHHWKYLHITE